MTKVLVTGGAGFIGSNFVRMLVDEGQYEVINLDALTYAGNLENLDGIAAATNYRFRKVDIADVDAVERAFSDEKPACVVHFAAESHVDRSVMEAGAFVRTNVLGTQVLLDAARRHGIERFVHVSTDEVYGTLGDIGSFTEDSPIRPNSPYAASKAGSDFLVRAAHRTHALDAIITRSSNNYGPFQFPEKLIPLMILNALDDKPLPVYGDGTNVRDWIHVIDHCRALLLVMEKGEAGATYNIGGNSERRNIDVVHRILELVGRDRELIRFVKDRPGHDHRYAIDATRLQEQLGFEPERNFDDGLAETVEWYRSHLGWCENVRTGEYRKYFGKQYGDLC